MAEQLGGDAYKVGGQPAFGGALANCFEEMEVQWGFIEDGEEKKKGRGDFNGDLTYSRRQTCQITADVLNGKEATVAGVLDDGGGLASGVWGTRAGVAAAWNIESAPRTETRGVVSYTINLVQQLEGLA